MEQEHEYALLGGINRAQVGRYIAIVAASVSSILVFSLLSLVDFAKSLGIPVILPPYILSLAGAASVFAALYWLFSRHVWRWPYLSNLLRVPNLAGDWTCEGKTLDENGAVVVEWNGTLTIVQTWDKLRVRMRTAHSGSNSITAALAYDQVDGFRLLYNYRNDPRIDEPDLRSHAGFADLTFAPDLRSADGIYFNGRGRFTFGTFHLVRV
jgi:hypothetical protein